MTDDIERIARGLTKAQREALSRREWSMIIQYRAGILEPERLGLLEPDAWGYRLTPLGKDVRDYLKGNSHAE